MPTTLTTRYNDRLMRQSPFITKFRRQNRNNKTSSSSSSSSSALPSLKDKLVRACLERARQKRRDLLRERRQRYDNGDDRHQHRRDGFGATDGVEECDDISQARLVLKEELERQGVSVYANIFDDSQQQRPQQQQGDVGKDSASSGNNTIGNSRVDGIINGTARMECAGEMLRGQTTEPTHDEMMDDACENSSGEEETIKTGVPCISEEEFIELLQQVDNELCREDEFFEEAMQAQEDEEMMRMQAEIEEFERWQEEEERATSNAMCDVDDQVEYDEW
eukprot:CAMPEP_0119547992 /NCGR_PEP_ID=MMETSP1352-20130426/2016_1 /TAXON_ID=265584 /ORGANISM="Stauroneis constricta, Strain CCMP1120" /LENGTH=277 /DNA_ID=CAMNT_0007593135 /DNA_START=18 /DNA_END=848 /DNA_ORIENTATION=-